MEQHMKQALIFFLGMIILLTISLFAGRKVFSPIERKLTQMSLMDQRSQNETGRTWNEAQYKKARLSFGSFDLFAGLTRDDLESMPAGTDCSFYFLIACLLLVGFLRSPGKLKKGTRDQP